LCVNVLSFTAVKYSFSGIFFNSTWFFIFWANRNDVTMPSVPRPTTTMQLYIILHSNNIILVHVVSYIFTVQYPNHHAFGLYRSSLKSPKCHNVYLTRRSVSVPSSGRGEGARSQIRFSDIEASRKRFI